jgi:2-oxoglutarate dehydrogenase E1 component
MANEPAIFSPSSLVYVEDLYANYLRDPASAPPAWQHYFAALTNGELNGGPAMSGPAFHPYSVFNPPAARRAGPAELSEPAVADLQERVDSLIRSYRSRGHIIAQIDPLRQPKSEPPELDPAYHGLTAADLDHPFACATMEPEHLLPLREIIERLRSTY